MKHFTLLAVLCLLAWQGNAQILNQAATWPNATWTISGAYAVGLPFAADPTASANFSYDDDEAGNGVANAINAESPVIDLTAAAGGGETWISVDYDYSHNDIGGSLDLQYYDADAMSWVAWENLGDNSALLVDWCPEIAAPIVTSAVLDISAFTATQLSGFQYRFAYDDAGGWQWGFCMSSPTVYSAMPPPCADPSALTIANITATGADFGWTDNSGNGLANIEYGPTGFTPGTGTLITGTTNNPETVAGLTSGTGYQFYVQSDCGGGDESNWIGPFSFNTAFQAPLGVTCGAGFATMIFSDDMETGIGWTGDIGTAAGDWDYPTGAPGGNSTGTGPSGPASGTTYAEYEASGSTALASMVTPMIDLSSGSTAAELSFYMHAFGANIGTLNVGIGNAPGGPFTTEFTWTGQFQTSAAQAWEQIGVDITAYLGQQIYVEFSYAATGPSFTGDMAIDLVQVETCVTCPAPGPFDLTLADFDSGEFAWTENGSATSWELEYGPVGFTPGTGTLQVTTQNPDSIVGLASDMFYEVYLTSICGPTDSSSIVGPVVFNTYNQGLYMDQDTECPLGGYVDISTTGVPFNLADDGETGLTLPFPLLYQGAIVTEMTIGNNGGILFNTLTGQVGLGGVVGAGTADGLYPFWDDLDSETGSIYIETVGTSPNQVTIIQYEQRPHFSGVVGQNITFQVQIEEATDEIYFVYEDVVFGGSQSGFDYGLSAGVGVAGPNQDIATSSNNATYLTNNTCAHYYYTNCPAPTNFAVTYTTTDEGAITWAAGIANETEWTVIYGVEGFDPTQTGTSVSTSSSVLIMPGLDDLTCYDVYIYADCSPILQSNGYMGTFCTLPNCANPSGITTLAAVDSVMTNWSWTENVGYPSTGFGIQYGWTGFTPNNGTTVWVDNNFSDTTEDMSLIGGGVYEMYVQAVCGTDSSAWNGPVTFTMPLTNDSTCFAEDLAVDGTMYTFDNAGATVDANETTVAPPATGAQTQDGWDNSNVNSTVWYTFTAPASGNVRANCEGINFDGQLAAYEVTDCNDFSTYTLVGANDDGALSTQPLMNLCGLTPGAQYYLMFDSWSTTLTGTYNLTLTDVVVEAGTYNGLTNICLGDTIDLYTTITGNDAGGVWSEDIPTANFNDPFFVSDGLASQVFDFEYMLVDGCASDSIASSVEIYAPSSAGIDGTISACMNQSINLMSGLSGNVDFGGAWYDPSNSLLGTANVVTGTIPGQFNYDYIAGNGVCPNDTSNVIVDVDGTCDALNLQSLYFDAMNLHPNPTTGMVYISNEGSSEVYNMELTDLNGKVITAKSAAINGTETTEVSLDKLETGIYMIRVYNDNAEKTFRVVKQ